MIRCTRRAAQSGAFAPVAYAGLLAGLALLTALVVWQGLEGLGAALATAGPLLLVLLPFHALPLLLDARGWQLLLRPLADEAGIAPPGLPQLLWLAMVREAISRLLPVASVGGDVEGIRLLARDGDVPLPLAAASVVVELLVTLLASALFVLLGLALLLGLRSAGSAASVPALGAACVAVLLAVAAPLALAAVLRRGDNFGVLARRLRGLLELGHPGSDPAGGTAEATAHVALAADRDVHAERVGSSPAFTARLAAGAAALDAASAALLRRPRTLAAATAWQLAGMLLGAAEVWWVLRLCGEPVGWPAALVIESLLLALRNLVFFVPGALGVQEAGVLALSAALGFGPPAAAALALAKRARELLFSAPVLLVWQWRLRRRGAPPRDPGDGLPPAAIV